MTSTNISTVTASTGRAIAAALTLSALSLGLVGAGATSASASDDDDDRVLVTGRCSAGAEWKLKVKPDDGRLEVEGEIDSNVAGQRWRWTLRHNGSVSDRGVGTTTARSGSFEVERKVVDLAGTDRIVFRAVRDGQTCRGVVNY
ncbi:hypothetical protein ACS3YM_05560 [Nocardia sp. N13]|uniref:hypothetical protein n=1 Tax=Nocardioides sp. N13(2025) TaxID=3453405 RepID=UPI003F75A8F7